jgi:hypothetical protein
MLSILTFCCLHSACEQTERKPRRKSATLRTLKKKFEHSEVRWSNIEVAKKVKGLRLVPKKGNISIPFLGEKFPKAEQKCSIFPIFRTLLFCFGKIFPKQRNTNVPFFWEVEKKKSRDIIFLVPNPEQNPNLDRTPNPEFRAWTESQIPNLEPRTPNPEPESNPEPRIPNLNRTPNLGPESSG